MLWVACVQTQEITMLNRSFSFGMKRVCRELTLMLVALALASVPFAAAQMQILAQLASTSLS
jgi:hypothetical protein